MTDSSEPIDHESTLRELEVAVRERDGGGIRARWEFGRYLLRHRENGRLPNGMRAILTTGLHLHPSEITARMKLAEKFATEEALATAISTFGTWFNLKQHGLKDGETTRKPPVRRGAAIVLKRVCDLLEGIDACDLKDGDDDVLQDILETVRRYRGQLASEKARRGAETNAEAQRLDQLLQTDDVPPDVLDAQASKVVESVATGQHDFLLPVPLKVARALSERFAVGPRNDGEPFPYAALAKRTLADILASGVR